MESLPTYTDWPPYRDLVLEPVPEGATEAAKVTGTRKHLSPSIQIFW